MIKIILIDNNTISTKGLKEYFRDPEIHIVAEATRGLSALSFIKQYSPDIAIINTSITDILPGKLCYFINKASPTTLNILISPTHHLPSLYQLLNNSNAKALLTMNSQFSGPEVIHTVYSGKNYLQPDLAYELFQYAMHQNQAIEKKLNNREFEVLTLSAQGKTVLEIANRCSISEKTVYNVKSRGIKKLGLKINDMLQLKQILLEKNMFSKNINTGNN